MSPPLTCEYASPLRRRSGASGFTLVEVVMAIGIVTAVMLPLVILLGQGIDHASDITSRDRALRLVPAIEERLNAASAFEARNWAQSGGTLFAYVFRGNPAIAEAVNGPGAATTGNDVFIAVARAKSDGRIASEISSIEGSMYRIDLNPVLPRPAANATGRKTRRQKANSTTAAAFEVDARISRVLSISDWQLSVAEPRLTLRFVINR